MKKFVFAALAAVALAGCAKEGDPNTTLDGQICVNGMCFGKAPTPPPPPPPPPPIQLAK